MAGKEINIPIAGDVSKFIRATDNVEDALDDVADSLDEVARESQRSSRDAERAVERVGEAYEEASDDADKLADAGRQAGDRIEDGADDGRSAVDSLETSFRDAVRSAKDLDDAGRDIGHGVEDGMKRAEEGVDEFKDEANSTAKEAAASFDGSAESIVDAFQEVAANAFAGFGPAGALAGLAAAAGIGSAVAGFEAVNEAEEKSRERASEWAQAYIEAGGKVLSAATTTALALDIATDPERFKEAQENAKNWGVDVSVAIAAMSGEAWALKAANDALAESEAKIGEEWDKAEGQYAGFGDALSSQNVQAERGRDSLNQLTEEMELGGQQADAYSRYLVALAEHTEGATTRVDEFGDSIITLPDGKEIYIDAETGQATTNVDQIEKRIYGIPDGNASVNLDTSRAQSELNRFVTQNNGATIKINGRFTVSGDTRYLP